MIKLKYVLSSLICFISFASNAADIANDYRKPVQLNLDLSEWRKSQEKLASIRQFIYENSKTLGLTDRIHFKETTFEIYPVNAVKKFFEGYIAILVCALRQNATSDTLWEISDAFKKNLMDLRIIFSSETTVPVSVINVAKTKVDRANVIEIINKIAKEYFIEFKDYLLDMRDEIINESVKNHRAFIIQYGATINQSHLSLRSFRDTIMH